MRQYGARTPSTSPTPGDLCLVLLQNKTTGALHALVKMLTPRGSAFLDEAIYDLEPGGACAFLSSASNDLLIMLPSGAHRLTLRGNDLRLLPGGGMKQRLTQTAPGGTHRWVLAVDVEGEVPSFDHALPSLEELMRQQAMSPELRDLFLTAAYPPVCTVLLPKAAPRKTPWSRLVIPEALFFVDRRTAECRTLDGGKVRISALGRAQLLFSVEAPEDEGVQVPLTLRAEMTPLRCVERWQLVYVCE
jgi:hypothetical protein